MEITHEVLLSLGFSPLFNRPQRYVYKGVIGRLQPDMGLFHFHGFSPMIEQVADLRYMLMLIDYNHNATFVGYPASLN